MKQPFLEWHSILVPLRFPFRNSRTLHNFVYQIAGNKLDKVAGRELSKAVKQNQEAEKIRKKITRLEDQLRKEVQFNIQVQLSTEINNLKKKLGY